MSGRDECECDAIGASSMSRLIHRAVELVRVGHTHNGDTYEDRYSTCIYAQRPRDLETTLADRYRPLSSSSCVSGASGKVKRW